MGLGLRNIRLLARELRGSQRRGRILTFGVQGVEGDYDLVAHELKKLNYPFVPLDTTTTDENTQFARSLHCSEFMKMLGYDEWESIDAWPEEGAGIIHNLNDPVPSHMHGRYDMIFDFGTTEHIFNVPQVLQNIHKMLKPSGSIVHILPSSGHMGHGFYQFCPSLFKTFYTSNKYADVRLFFLFFRRFAHHYVEITNDSDVPLDQLGTTLSGICVMATRTEENSDEVSFPMQDMYSEGIDYTSWLEGRSVVIKWLYGVREYMGSWGKLMFDRLERRYKYWRWIISNSGRITRL